MKDGFAIFCCGSLGKELFDFLRIDGCDDIVFIDDVTQQKEYRGVPVYTFCDFVNKEKNRPVIIASGEPIYRKKLKDKILGEGCTLGTFVSSRAIIGSDCRIESGAIILPNVYIGHNTHIKANAIIHSGALLEEGVTVGEDTFVSLGAFVGAKTVIGKQCFIGPNSTIRDSIRIEDCCIVGMASCVTKSLQKGTYGGNPARLLSEKQGLIFGQKS